MRNTRWLPSKRYIPISQHVHKIGTKSQPLYLCFRGPPNQWDYRDCWTVEGLNRKLEIQDGGLQTWKYHISACIDIIWTKFRRLYLCFRGIAILMEQSRLLYCLTGSEKSTMASFKPEVTICIRRQNGEQNFNGNNYQCFGSSYRLIKNRKWYMHTIRTKEVSVIDDQMIDTYWCKEATRRWPMVVFYTMVDVALCCGYSRTQDVIRRNVVSDEDISFTSWAWP